MVESCGMQVAKYLLFGFNLVFAITGLAVLVTGAVVLAEIREYQAFMEGRIMGPPIVLIVVGLIIFIVAFLGCCGAIKESTTMLIAYAVFLLIIFIVEMAVGITAAVAKEDFQDAMKDAMKDSMKEYQTDSAHRAAWDATQKEYMCCGVLQAQDWSGKLTDGAFAPQSCCRQNNRSCRNTTAADMYRDGCYEALKNRVKDRALVLAGVGMGIAFVEVAGIILAFCLVSAIRNSAEK